MFSQLLVCPLQKSAASRVRNVRSDLQDESLKRGRCEYRKMIAGHGGIDVHVSNGRGVQLVGVFLDPRNRSELTQLFAVPTAEPYRTSRTPAFTEKRAQAASHF